MPGAIDDAGDNESAISSICHGQSVQDTKVHLQITDVLGPWTSNQVGSAPCKSASQRVSSKHQSQLPPLNKMEILY